MTMNIYQQRQEQIRAAMRAEKLDALILAGRGVIAQHGLLMFAVGYCPVIRPAYAALTASGETLLFVTTPSDVWLAENAGAAARVIECSPSKCAEALASAGKLGPAPRIGVAGLDEIVPAGVFDAWRSALPAAQFIPAAAMMEEVKLVKSAADLAGVRRVAGQLDEAMEEVQTSLRAGATFRVAAGRAEGFLRANGAIEILVYASDKPHFLHRPDDARPQPGRLVTVFVEASSPEGHWAELARLFAHGPLDAVGARVAAACHAAMAETEATLIPGTSASAAFAAIDKSITSSGFSSGLWLGHGVGIDHDGPVIGPDDQRLLQADMVLAMHPHLVDAGGHTGGSLGDTFHITANGPQALSGIARDVIDVR
jgi:Xaa-Pro aminopeptidase